MIYVLTHVALKGQILHFCHVPYCSGSKIQFYDDVDKWSMDM